MESYIYYSKKTTSGPNAPSEALYKAVFKNGEDTNPTVYKLSKARARVVPETTTADGRKGTHLRGWCREAEPDKAQERACGRQAEHVHEPSKTHSHDHSAQAKTGGADANRGAAKQTQVPMDQGGGMKVGSRPPQSVERERPREEPSRGKGSIGISSLPVRVQTYLDLAYGPVNGHLRRETMESSDAILRGIFEQLVGLDKAQRAVLREEVGRRAKRS